MFYEAHFKNAARFEGACFSGDADFTYAQFHAEALFKNARFTSDAVFSATKFGATWFDGAQFSRDTRFDKAEFSGPGWFEDARFKQARSLGPLHAAYTIILDRAIFDQPITIEVASQALSCVGTRFNERATLRLRYANILVDRATFTKPSTIAFAESTLKSSPGQVMGPFNEESVVSVAGSRSPQPRLLSLREVDVATLTLADLDLGACRFQGAHNLDALRIEGARPFASTPRGWKLRWVAQGMPLWRWTRRQTVAEEHHWRASRELPATSNGRPHPQLEGWYPAEMQPTRWAIHHSGQDVQRLGPDRLAVLYRSLRKAQEDSKDEPGAADFYYGEMEMRRLAPTTPWGERVILTLYWLISGYGQRGSRALAWLAVVVFGSALLFELVGFAQHPQPLTMWGSLLYIVRSALSVTDPEAQLTAWGKLLQIILRVAAPILIGLTLLAVRNRVKR